MHPSSPLPAPSSTLERLLIHSLRSFNGLLHVVLAVALVVASSMVVWEFCTEALSAFQKGQLAHGFLHALGVLFIVWTLSALISAEIDYVHTNRFHLKVFVEVAMITLLRQLIIRPVQAVSGDVNPGDWQGAWQYGLLLAGLLTVAVTHRLIDETPKNTP